MGFKVRAGLFPCVAVYKDSPMKSFNPEAFQIIGLYESLPGNMFFDASRIRETGSKKPLTLTMRSGVNSKQQRYTRIEGVIFRAAGFTTARGGYLSSSSSSSSSKHQSIKTITNFALSVIITPQVDEGYHHHLKYWVCERFKVSRIAGWHPPKAHATGETPEP